MKNNKLIINNNNRAGRQQAGRQQAGRRPRQRMAGNGPTVRGVTSANYRQQAKTVAYNYAATPAAAAAATATATAPYALTTQRSSSS